MRKALLVITIIVAPMIIVVACSKGDPGDNGGGGGGGGGALDCSTITNKNFAANINPIIQSFCNQAACHDVASINGPGPLTNYTQVFNARVNIRSAVASGFMPQNATLTASQRNSILCWIDSGAPNN